MLWVPPGFAHGFLVLPKPPSSSTRPPTTGTRSTSARCSGTTRRSGSTGRSPARRARRQGRRGHAAARRRSLPVGGDACAGRFWSPARRPGRLRARAAAAPLGDVVATDARRSTSPIPTRSSRAVRERRARRDRQRRRLHGGRPRRDASRDCAHRGQRRARRACSPRRRSAPARCSIHYSTDYVFDGARTRRTRRMRRPSRSTSTARASSRASARSRRPARTRSCCARAGCTAARQELPADDPAARRGARRAARRRRPARRAELEPRARRGDGPLVARGCRRWPSAPGSITCRATGAGELVRLCARDRRRRGAAAGRADHDRRISAAGAPPGLWRARHGPVRGDVRVRAPGLARRAGELRRESRGPGVTPRNRRPCAHEGRRWVRHESACNNAGFIQADPAATLDRADVDIGDRGAGHIASGRRRATARSEVPG